MVTAQSTAAHVMDSSMGAAMRVQLDAMVNALQPIDQEATDAGDAAVSRLIARLYEAREAASEIEMRPQPAPIAVLPLSRGISLRRR